MNDLGQVVRYETGPLVMLGQADPDCSGQYLGRVFHLSADRRRHVGRLQVPEDGQLVFGVGHCFHVTVHRQIGQRSELFIGVGGEGDRVFVVQAADIVQVEPAGLVRVHVENVWVPLFRM